MKRQLAHEFKQARRASQAQRSVSSINVDDLAEIGDRFVLAAIGQRAVQVQLEGAVEFLEGRPTEVADAPLLVEQPEPLAGVPHSFNPSHAIYVNQVTNQLQVDIRGLNQADAVRQPAHPGPHAVYQDTATGRLHVDIQEQDSWVYEKEVADLRKAHPQLTPEQALHAVKQWSRRQSATADMPGVETQQSTTDSA
eukprot:COSAG01_NODE_6371_length_3707_cov_7.909922_5_plen_195_part_00